MNITLLCSKCIVARGQRVICSRVEHLHLVGFRHQHLQVCICPVLRWNRLKKNHGVLVLEVLELRRKFQKEHSAYVTMELAKAFIFGEVSVPEFDDLVNVELSCQIARDPPIREIHEREVHLLKLHQAFGVRIFYQSSHFVQLLVNTGLEFCVVVLDVGNKLV